MWVEWCGANRCSELAPPSAGPRGWSLFGLQLGGGGGDYMVFTFQLYCGVSGGSPLALNLDRPLYPLAVCTMPTAVSSLHSLCASIRGSIPPGI